MDVFKFDDYRAYLIEIVRLQSKETKGILSVFAKAMNIHSSLMSMIISGKRDLSIEQAYDLCHFLELTAAETDFFILLVQAERSGTKRLKSYWLDKAKDLKKRSGLLKNKLSGHQVLSDSEQSIFYSNWLYSAIHLYCSLGKKGKTIQEIAQEFNKSRKVIVEVANFLCSIHLLIEKNGYYQMSTKSTLIGRDSPYLLRHHLNWRNRALVRMDDLTDQELMVTAPFSISRQDFIKLRELLIEYVKRTTKIIQGSPEELVGCMNLDLFCVSSFDLLKEGNLNEDNEK